MKCKHCNGTGYLKTISVGAVPCSACNGTGEIPITNDEWRKTCSTEEFAEWLFRYSLDKCSLCGHCWDENICPLCERRSDKDFFEKWLKEEHDEM